MKPRRYTLHVAIAKELLLGIIRREGVAAALKDWPGTAAEALAAIESDGRAWFVLDQECDKQGPDGSCLGHEVPQPVRVQRKRTRGWKMPENTVYVGRPTKWGNPFQVVDVLDAYCGNELEARADCVRSYREALLNGDKAYIELHAAVDAMRELRGKNLACWCPLDQPCHADVLLEIANQ